MIKQLEYSTKDKNHKSPTDLHYIQNSLYNKNTVWQMLLSEKIRYTNSFDY